MNVFKFGKTSWIEPRLSAYNVGHVYKTQFHYLVEVEDCAGFERAFADMMNDYRVFKRKEFIKVNEDFMIEKLKTLLMQRTR